MSGAPRQALAFLTLVTVVAATALVATDATGVAFAGPSVSASALVERGGLPADPARGLVPGETSRVFVRLEDAEGLEVAIAAAELASQTPGVSALASTVNGVLVNGVFEVRTDAAVPCGGTALFTLTGDSAAGPFTLPLALPIGEPALGPASVIATSGPAALAAHGTGVAALAGPQLLLPGGEVLPLSLQPDDLASDGERIAIAGTREGATFLRMAVPAGPRVDVGGASAIPPRVVHAPGVTGGFAVLFFEPAADGFALRLASFTGPVATLATGLVRPEALDAAASGNAVGALYAADGAAWFVECGEAGVSAAVRIWEAPTVRALAITHAADAAGGFIVAHARGREIEALRAGGGRIEWLGQFVADTAVLTLDAIASPGVTAGAEVVWSERAATRVARIPAGPGALSGAPLTGPAQSLRLAAAAGGRSLVFVDGAGIVRLRSFGDAITCSPSPEPLAPLVDGDGDTYEPPADCNDNDPNIHPGATEICNAVDDDCDGSIDEDLALNTYFADADLDTYGDPSATTQTCAGIPPAGYVANSADCNDADPAVNPAALEICDGADTDCDGSVDEVAGDRHVAPAGSNAGNDCTNPLAPCATITHAAAIACLGETVRVAEGEYVEDVLLERQVNVASAGLAINTQLRGTGAADVVRILASGVTWSGIEIGRTPTRACLRIGDAAHPNVRDVQVSNAALYGCRIGAIIDSTGYPAEPGRWNRLLGMDVRDNVADGSPDSGVGVLAVGGTGKLEIKAGRLVNNAGPGLRVAAGAGNHSIVLAGEYIFGNGMAANADGIAGVEVHGVTNMRMEGNDIVGQAGGAATGDGRGAIYDAVSSGTFYCNRVRGNEGGLALAGASTGVDVRQNQFRENTTFGLHVADGSLAGVSARENIFAANLLALENLDAGVLDARRSWWNAIDGSASAGGSGDTFTGNVLAGDFIPRAAAPLLVRAPSDSGWDPSVNSCFQRIQQAVTEAAAGAFILVGPGTYPERPLVDKPLEIEGTHGGSGCSPSVVSAPQAGGSHLPAFRVTGVTGATIRQLTIRDAGLGTPCGAASGDEVGLDLLDVGQSTFQDICLRQNGVTELRVRGNSDDNVFERFSIDGVIRAVSGEDLCGHRSRAGVVLDGWPACEGGAGALAERNALREFTIDGVATGALIRLADGTELSGGTIHVSRAPAWDGGTYAAGVRVDMAVDTLISGNVIESALQNDGVRISGRGSGSCATERTDTLRTTLTGNTIRLATQAGIRNYRNGPGSGFPLGTSIRCNTIRQNATGVFLDAVGSGPDAAVLRTNDVVANTVGVRNLAVELVDADHNWWGAMNGPGGDGPGSGDAIYGSATFADWLHSSAQDDSDADGLSECAGDCDDTNAGISPAQPELCNGIDDDCDGSIDEGAPPITYYADADLDTYGDPESTSQDCAVTPPAGYVANSGDCDDTNPAIHPGAREFCSDLVDNDCDLAVDDVDPFCADLLVTGLVFSGPGTSEITWSPASGASSYGLQRGTIPTGGWTGYDHACVATLLPTAAGDDAAVPPAGTAFYYLALGQVTDAGGLANGPLGRASSGSPRPESATSPCGPTP